MKGGGTRENGTAQYPAAHNSQSQARCRTEAGHQCSGAYSAPAGAAFQFDADDTERTVMQWREQEDEIGVW